MTATSQQKGKFGELWVFGKLIDKGVNVYLPMVDEEGIDAIIRKKDGSLLEIQVKSTRAKDQAGYFNVKANKLHPKDNLFVICADMSPLDATPARQPEVWIFPSSTFVQYSTLTSGEYRLALPDGKIKYGKPLKELLTQYCEAWGLLTA
jgi:hypothetical protein